MQIKYVALMTGNFIGRGVYSAPEGKSLNIPYANYDEVIEISEELAKGDYPLEKHNGQIRVHSEKKIKIDADKAKFQGISEKIENEETITDQEYKWYKKHGGQ